MTQLPEGPAFLALWNSIHDTGRRHEYEQWHIYEHVPERVALPGFLGADRYRSVDAEPSYFTVYHLESLAALSTEPYRDVFTHPTPWSASMRPLLSDFYRLPCVRASSAGSSRAPHLGTLRWSANAALPPGLLDDWLNEAIDTGRLLHAQWGWAPSMDSYWLANASSETADHGVEHVALLQHHDPDGLRVALDSLSDWLRPHASRLGERQRFSLQSSIRNTDVDKPVTGRRPPNTILFPHHSRG